MRTEKFFKRFRFHTAIIRCGQFAVNRYFVISVMTTRKIACSVGDVSMKFIEMFDLELEKTGAKSFRQKAEKCGMSPDYLRIILRGLRPPPQDDKIINACEMLGLSDLRTRELLVAAARDRSKGDSNQWDEVIEDLFQKALNRTDQLDRKSVV